MCCSSSEVRDLGTTSSSMYVFYMCKDHILPVVPCHTLCHDIYRLVDDGLKQLKRMVDNGVTNGTPIIFLKYINVDLKDFINTFIRKNPARRMWLENSGVAFKGKGPCSTITLQLNKESLHSPVSHIDISNCPFSDLLDLPWDSCLTRKLQKPVQVEDVFVTPEPKLLKRKYIDISGRSQRRRMEKVVPKINNAFQEMGADDLENRAAVMNDYRKRYRMNSNNSENKCNVDLMGMLRESDDPVQAYKVFKCYDNITKKFNNKVIRAVCNDKKRRNKIKQMLSKKPRKIRSDKIEGKFIYDYIHDEFRVNTFAPKIKCKNPYTGEIEKHQQHEQPGTLEEIYYNFFLHSTQYKSHLQQHPTKRICFSLFKKHAKCKCLKHPKFLVCADEVEVGMEEVIRSADNIRRKTTPLPTCQFCKIQEAIINDSNRQTTYHHPLSSLHAFMKTHIAHKWKAHLRKGMDIKCTRCAVVP